MKYAPLIVKIALALLLFACLGDHPYEFYNFVRWACAVGFVYLAYKAQSQANTDLAIAYGGLAVLFQPLVKIQLGRQLWNTVDVVLGILLLASAAWEVFQWWRQRSARS